MGVEDPAEKVPPDGKGGGRDEPCENSLTSHDSYVFINALVR